MGKFNNFRRIKGRGRGGINRYSRTNNNNINNINNNKLIRCLVKVIQYAPRTERRPFESDELGTDREDII